MGRTLAQAHPEIADLYRRANEIVGFDLARLCFEGPAEELDTTEISQPAIFTTSAACLLALRSGYLAPELKDVQPDACAGLSLGEYTALYAAGAMDFDDALRLVRIRGRSMQQAANEQKGTMVSVLGLDEAQVDDICRQVLAEKPAEADGRQPVLAPVNFNCPGQIVLSGTLSACRMAQEQAEKAGAKAVPLRVAGAFHTVMMHSAAERLREGLAQCRLQAPRCPVIANVDAALYDGLTSISAKLLAQLVSPVRWQQSVEKLIAGGAQQFVEIGPGRVLTGLVKKISRGSDKKVAIINVSA